MRLPMRHHAARWRPGGRAIAALIFLAVLIALAGSATLVARGAPVELASAVADASVCGRPAPGWTCVLTLPQPPRFPSGYNPGAFVPQVAWSPAVPRTLYVCQSGMVAAGSRDTMLAPPALYRSDDLGGHWWRLPIPSRHGCLLSVDPAVAGTLTLDDESNPRYLSRDAGRHWQPIPAPPEAGPGYQAPVRVVAGRVYVGSYWTRDLRTWTRWNLDADLPSQAFNRMIPPMPGPYTGRERVDGQRMIFLAKAMIDPQHPDTLYLISGNCPGAPHTEYGTLVGICRTDDDGRTWRFLTLVGTPWLSSLFLADARPNVVYSLGGETQVSRDGGATWRPLPFSYFGADHVVLWLGLAADGTLYSAARHATTVREVEVPAGVSRYRGDGAWQPLAPFPLPDALFNQEVHVQLLTPAAGPSQLIAYTSTAVYRYTGAIPWQ